MIKRADGDYRPYSRAIALAAVVWSFADSTAMSYDDGPAVPGQKVQKWGKFIHKPWGSGKGTSKSDAPGFQGFGLGYHPGYGYGGAALGVGPMGGYPSFGGPGYPQPWPTLNRLGPITPFCYFGGPGYPSPGLPHFFGSVGPLALDQPVVTFQGESPDSGYAGGYGAFSGAIPYPEATFAPSTSMPAGGESSGVATPPPAAGPATAAPPASSTRRE